MLLASPFHAGTLLPEATNRGAAGNRWDLARQQRVACPGCGYVRALQHVPRREHPGSEEPLVASASLALDRPGKLKGEKKRLV